MGARSELRDPLMLCGTMFGLPIPRHRLFETNWSLLMAPGHPNCRGVAKTYAARRGWDWRDMTVTGKGRHAGTLTRWQEVMGIDWHMSQHQMVEAIPPSYTEWIATLPSSERTRRVKCDNCGDWACAEHGGHIGEKCECWPCDDCGELVDPRHLEVGLCPDCKAVAV